MFDWTKVALKIKSLHFALQAHLLGHSDAYSHTPSTLSFSWAPAQVDIDDRTIPIGIINVQVILEGHGQ